MRHDTEFINRHLRGDYGKHTQRLAKNLILAYFGTAKIMPSPEVAAHELRAIIRSTPNHINLD